MCGIVGANSIRNITPILAEGLKRLEYRGYDSAGVALLDTTKELQRCRVKGKVQDLVEALEKNQKNLAGHLGIAHTRWATHGSPSEVNAHPHVSNNTVALVHNGIIENHQEIRESLTQRGYEFSSETDTEVIVHLVHYYLKNFNQDLLKSVQAAVKELKGAYGLAIISQADPDKLIAVRHGSPLVVGIGFEENFVASDPVALLPVTQNFLFLEEGDCVELYQDKFFIYNSNNKLVTRKQKKLDLAYDAADKGHYRHYMQKEIFEQVRAVQQALEGRITENNILENIFGEQAKKIFPKVEQVKISACGTSYHAGMIAKYWIEEIANLPCSVEIASELRYRKTVVRNNTLFICISQSGETADVLAALRQSKELNYLASLAICNVPESSIVRESDMALLTRAGTEVGVASTKAFTTQLVALLLVTITLAKLANTQGSTQNNFDPSELVNALHSLPNKISETLALDKQIEKLSEFFTEKHHALFLGRGTHYPVALEGALKLKEISYIHAEAYPAGELKHGPLALVDKEMPVIAVAPSDELLEKLKSNLEEVRSRGGELIIFTDQSTGIKTQSGITVFHLPQVDRIIAPIVYTIPLQLLSYHVALIKGTDVDQPRNLAKSVTVE